MNQIEGKIRSLLFIVAILEAYLKNEDQLDSHGVLKSSARRVGIVENTAEEANNLVWANQGARPKNTNSNPTECNTAEEANNLRWANQGARPKNTNSNPTECNTAEETNNLRWANQGARPKNTKSNPTECNTAEETNNLRWANQGARPKNTKSNPTECNTAEETNNLRWANQGARPKNTNSNPTECNTAEEANNLRWANQGARPKSTKSNPTEWNKSVVPVPPKIRPVTKNSSVHPLLLKKPSDSDNTTGEGKSGKVTSVYGADYLTFMPFYKKNDYLSILKFFLAKAIGFSIADENEHYIVIGEEQINQKLGSLLQFRHEILLMGQAKALTVKYPCLMTRNEFWNSYHDSDTVVNGIKKFPSQKQGLHNLNGIDSTESSYKDSELFLRNASFAASPQYNLDYTVMNIFIHVRIGLRQLRRALRSASR